MSNQVTLKDIKYYENNKRYFNKLYNNLTKKYISSKRIGRCSFLYKKYNTNNYQEFANKYFNDYHNNNFNEVTLYGNEYYGRSEKQILLLAKKLKDELKHDSNITFEMCFDLLITHIIIETIDGHIVENEIIEHLKSYNKYNINNEIDITDSDFNVDITVRYNTNNKLVSYIQVKPISTFLSPSEGVKADRYNFFKKQEKFNDYLIKNNKPNEVKEIVYMVYEKKNTDDSKHKFLVNPKTNKKTFKLNELTDIYGNVILNKSELIFDYL
jgi:hypothetical protein